MESPKTEAIELIGRLPNGVTSAENVDALYFKWQVEVGLADIAAGRTLTHEELKERLTPVASAGRQVGVGYAYN